MATVSRRGPRPRSDIYTGLLAISLAALLAGCAFLYLDYSQYGKKTPDPLPAPGAVAPGGSPGH